jgi:TetR/AcrR family transcriptional repressor of nem operon
MGRVSDARERLMKAVMELMWTESYGATTIDQICEKAGVKKGSFYYFFDSKADLAQQALDVEWKLYRPQLDAIFSATVSPLERIRNHCDFNYKEQAELKRKHGYVLGCPLCTLGAEISTQENGLRKLVQEIMDQCRKYIESAIRDAHAAGLVDVPNAAAKARIVYAYSEGLMTQARIQNDLSLLREMGAGIFDILGVKQVRAVA